VCVVCAASSLCVKVPIFTWRVQGAMGLFTDYVRSFRGVVENLVSHFNVIAVLYCHVAGKL